MRNQLGVNLAEVVPFDLVGVAWMRSVNLAEVVPFDLVGVAWLRSQLGVNLAEVANLVVAWLRNHQLGGNLAAVAPFGDLTGVADVLVGISLSEFCHPAH